MMTVVPARASSRVVWKPMPLLAPVTEASLPCCCGIWAAVQWVMVFLSHGLGGRLQHRTFGSAVDGPGSRVGVPGGPSGCGSRECLFPKWVGDLGGRYLWGRRSGK